MMRVLSPSQKANIDRFNAETRFVHGTTTTRTPTPVSRRTRQRTAAQSKAPAFKSSTSQRRQARIDQQRAQRDARALARRHRAQLAEQAAEDSDNEEAPEVQAPEKKVEEEAPENKEEKEEKCMCGADTQRCKTPCGRPMCPNCIGRAFWHALGSPASDPNSVGSLAAHLPGISTTKLLCAEIKRSGMAMSDDGFKWFKGAIAFLCRGAKAGQFKQHATNLLKHISELGQQALSVAQAEEALQVIHDTGLDNITDVHVVITALVCMCMAPWAIDPRLGLSGVCYRGNLGEEPGLGVGVLQVRSNRLWLRLPHRDMAMHICSDADTVKKEVDWNFACCSHKSASDRGNLKEYNWW